MGIADLHMHTTSSDGSADIKDMLDFVAAKRPFLDVIAITDHDTSDAANWAIEHATDYPFDIIPGVEVSSHDGHILGLWVNTTIPTDLSLQETVAAIHEAGGIAILAHPFHIEMDIVFRNAWRYFQHPEVLLEAELDAIEVYNAGGVLSFTNFLAQSVCNRVGLTKVGNSDAHTLGAIGRGKTYFPGKTAIDLRQALLSGKTTVKGTRWALTDYLEYLQNEIQRKVSRYSANMNSSHRVSS